MIATRKSISRRAVLRGMGASLALPVLDAMVPAFSALAATPANPVRRVGLIYIGNGAVMPTWTPRIDGSAFDMTPALEPLAPFRDKLLILTGLGSKPADALAGEPAAGHGRVSGAFLTGVHCKPTEGADFRAGVSIDQIAATQLGQETQLASLEIQTDTTDLAGACDAGFSCAYQNTLCWRTPTTPLPMDNNPRSVFERLFGDSGSTDPAVRLANVQRDRSILDSVTSKVNSLQNRLGARDRAKLTEYLEAVRDVERRIQKAESQGKRELPLVEQPAGIPATFEEHAKLMFDLQVLAYQVDLTRVITFYFIREQSNRAYPELGVPDGHHALSHHREDPDKLAKITKINTYHTKLFAYYLDKLKSTPDGDGSLLDHVMILYGAGMGNSNNHDPHDLPMLLVGGGAGGIKGGRHIRLPNDTPLTNLHVTLLHKLGVASERIGDSTGEIKEISGI